MKYYQVLISAEDQKQANTILDKLLTRKLILGGPILKGPAKFWWKGKIVKMNYCYILTYTTRKHMKAVINETKKASVEEIPMISFFPFEGNIELIKLIDKTFG
ncbi:MAG: divalent cation tolerance protein CutA [Candidatus Azambacteria bacterium]|nr:divalent cation tolerance protein CutA [Candidatus Azambacteria bacterium]